MIHYDPWWNLAVQNQATDRAHRIGQQNVVSVYRLFMKDTIEERIRALQERKRELADEILSGEGNRPGFDQQRGSTGAARQVKFLTESSKFPASITKSNTQ